MNSVILLRRLRVLWGTATTVFLVSFLWLTLPAPAGGQTVIATVPVDGSPLLAAWE
jgi:hypothetical protein